MALFGTFRQRKNSAIPQYACGSLENAPVERSRSAQFHIEMAVGPCCNCDCGRATWALTLTHPFLSWSAPEDAQIWSMEWIRSACVGRATHRLGVQRYFRRQHGRHARVARPASCTHLTSTVFRFVAVFAQTPGRRRKDGDSEYSIFCLQMSFAAPRI